MKSGVGSLKIRGVLEFLRIYRLKSMVNRSSESDAMVATVSRRPIIRDNGFGNMQLDGLKFIHANTTNVNSLGSKGNNKGKCIQSASPKSPSSRPPSSPRGGFPNWTRLVLGSVFSLLLAFFTPNLPTILRIGGEAEVMMKEVEQAAEVVEKVAVVVEKLSNDVIDSLPDGNEFKDTALIVEHVSRETAKDALVLEEILHKLDVVKNDLGVVEEIIEPLIDGIECNNKSNKEVKT